MPDRTPFGRLQLRVVRRLPRPLIEDPFEILLSFMCLMTGIPLILGVSRPGAIDHLMPGWFIKVWGAALLIGALCIFSGFIRRMRHTIYGKAIERIGLLLLAYASCIYTVAIFGTTGTRGLPAALIVLGFAGTCFVKAFIIKVSIMHAEHLLQ